MQGGPQETTGWSSSELENAFHVLDKVFTSSGDPLDQTKLETLLAQIPKLAEIIEGDQEFEEIKAGRVNYEEPMTRTILEDIIIDDWFNIKAGAHMSDPNQTTDTNVRQYFYSFAYELAKDMYSAHLDSVGPENSVIWKKYFESNDLAMVNGRYGCPLVKEDNKNRFAPTILREYFVARSMMDEANKSDRPRP